MLSGMLQETRRLLADIRPLALDDLGLVEMLRRHLYEISREHGVDVSINSGALAPSLPHHLQVALYRLLQGMVGAILVPDRAGRLVVTLRSEEDYVIAQIETEGPVADGAVGRLNGYLANPFLTRRLELLEGVVNNTTAGDGAARLVLQLSARAAA